MQEIYYPHDTCIGHCFQILITGWKKFYRDNMGRKDTRIPDLETSHVLIEFFHNSRLIRQILQIKFPKKLQTWPGIEPGSLDWLSGTLTITLECFLWMCETVNRSWFMHDWFCLIHLVHLIGWKSLQYKKLDCMRIGPTFMYFACGSKIMPFEIMSSICCQR